MTRPALIALAALFTACSTPAAETVEAQFVAGQLARRCEQPWPVGLAPDGLMPTVVEDVLVLAGPLDEDAADLVDLLLQDPGAAFVVVTDASGPGTPVADRLAGRNLPTCLAPGAPNTPAARAVLDG